jgi:hypothetical protein
VEASLNQKVKMLSEKKLNPISATEDIITDIVAPTNWRLPEQIDLNDREPQS